jgi:hypothetical protein
MKRTSGSSRDARANGSCPFWTSVPRSTAPTVSASRSFGSLGSPPNGSGTPWWITVTLAGDTGVLRSISLSE